MREAVKLNQSGTPCLFREINKKHGRINLVFFSTKEGSLDYCMVNLRKIALWSQSSSNFSLLEDNAVKNGSNCRAKFL